jgi:hypothetical protein
VRRPAKKQKVQTHQNSISLEQAIEDLRRLPVVPLWPHVAVLLDLTRNGAYDAAKRGDVEILKLGRLKKAISAPLRKQLGIEAA